MTLADRFAWQHFKSVYRQRFGRQVPDWACAMDMTGKLRLVRAACAIAMSLAQAVLLRDEALDPGSRWV